MSTLIPVERLWELYDCDPFTGTLYSKKNRRPRKGSFKKRRHNLEVPFNGKLHWVGYGAAVYAWCVGEWAQPTVDHKDRNPRNHAIHNLIPATQREQIQNQKKFNGGATYRKHSGRWYARINVDGQKHYLGTFDTEAEAQQAYKDALNALGAP